MQMAPGSGGGFPTPVINTRQQSIVHTIVCVPINQSITLLSANQSITVLSINQAPD
jgi:hypothetical protein